VDRCDHRMMPPCPKCGSCLVHRFIYPWGRKPMREEYICRNCQIRLIPNKPATETRTGRRGAKSRKEVRATPADIAALIAYSTEEGRQKGWR